MLFVKTELGTFSSTASVVWNVMISPTWNCTAFIAFKTSTEREVRLATLTCISLREVWASMMIVLAWCFSLYEC